MRDRFINWQPNEKSVSIVVAADAICREYADQGYDLTLRQLYYQFVARDLIPNTQRSYKNLGTAIDNARLAGLLDWSYIVDRTRNVYRTDGLDTSPDEAIRMTAASYARALWTNQPWHVEVWVEKEALAGVVQRAANQVGVNYFACRGYVSQSEMYSAGQRFARYARAGKETLVLHLGDHDPSGIDMSRDIEDRLHQFSRRWDTPRVKRIALNMDQVDQYQPPPNPAKLTDSRIDKYMAEFGDESWELDALEPSVLADLITSEVYAVRDEEQWAEDHAQQERERSQLTTISDQWAEVVEAFA